MGRYFYGRLGGQLGGKGRRRRRRKGEGERLWDFRSLGQIGLSRENI